MTDNIEIQTANSGFKTMESSYSNVKSSTLKCGQVTVRQVTWE